VAELVDAADSKSAIRKDVLVRFQSRALCNPCISLITIDLQGLIILGHSLFTSFLRFLPLFSVTNTILFDWDCAMGCKDVMVKGAAHPMDRFIVISDHHSPSL
jgi:hypothetical protein